MLPTERSISPWDNINTAPRAIIPVKDAYLKTIIIFETWKKVWVDKLKTTNNKVNAIKIPISLKRDNLNLMPVNLKPESFIY